MISPFRSIVIKALKNFKKGQITITFPNDQQLTIGDAPQPLQARLRIINDCFFQKIVLYGDIGFSEAYVDGDWETDDLVKTLSWFILNYEYLPTSASPVRNALLNIFKGINRITHSLRPNTKSGSSRNIIAHYDLGNDLYRLLLDPSMTYSSAFFTAPGQSLEVAQEEKYRQLCDKIGLKEKDHVLEIGCGWGGFAIFAAEQFGCAVTGVTLSPSQKSWAEEKIKQKGLDDRVTIKLCDYRDIQGRYDKIVSIEMIEAVGYAFFKSFFECCHRLLKSEGVLGLQVILFPDSRYHSRRKRVDWIQKHIFPGGHLPSLSALNQAIHKTTDFWLHRFDCFGQSYKRTLNYWRSAFNQKEKEVKALGFDDTFIRKWNYYLCYCEAGFLMRHINVAQIIYTRPNNTQFE